jgi:hypothetical protein
MPPLPPVAGGGVVPPLPPVPMGGVVTTGVVPPLPPVPMGELADRRSETTACRTLDYATLLLSPTGTSATADYRRHAIRRIY